MQIHVVERGQVLWQLAQFYRVTVEEIVTANELPNPNQLTVGQALVIPTPQDRYVVQPGDSLYRIAQAHGTSVEVLVRENRLRDPNVLYIGQVLRVPARTLPVVEANAYLTDFSTTGQRTVTQLAPYLTYVSPFSHHVGADGSLTTFDDSALLTLAESKDIRPLLVITNWSGHMFSSDIAHTVLNSASVQDTLISNILDTMKSKGYRGLNIDFEYVYPNDREAYNQFLEKVVTRLHAENYLVSTALAPKETANQVGLLYEAHDYPVHGRLCDFVVLMTYEWGWAGGPPWAIAPINKVEDVLNYAVTVIPRDKILMGVPVYGRDWKLPYVSGKSLAQTFDPQVALARAATYGAAIQYNELYQAPYYNYVDAQGNRHQVWFEDARSYQAKLDTVKSYRLRGISYWSYPSNFPQVPWVFAANFRARKL